MNSHGSPNSYNPDSLNESEKLSDSNYSQTQHKDQEKEAEYYKKTNSTAVCLLCPKQCIISEGKTGFCKVRKFKDGKLILLNYPYPCSIAIDPIEKKPFYHFKPKSRVFSIATAGCNMACKHCQNDSISQSRPTDFERKSYTPEEIVKEVQQSGCDIIAYTYTEPTIFFEYMKDIAKLARKRGIQNVIVSNGFINQEPLKELLPLIDGANIDLKSMDDTFYQKICAARLNPVLETIKTLILNGVWVEITNLIIPSLNDSPDKIKKLIDWVAEQGIDIPLHISRFYPAYKLMNLPPTPIETLMNAYELAKKKLNFVYLGNTSEPNVQNTICPSCNQTLIERSNFGVVKNTIEQGKCPNCKKEIAGRWD